MPKTAKICPLRTKIRLALCDAAKNFVAAHRKKHPRETPYAFLFEISCEGFSAHGALATEEALVRHAKSQLKELRRIKAADPLALVCSGFRWAGPEDGWYQQPDKKFDAVNRLLRRAEKDALYDYYDGTLNDLCLDALRELDQVGVFGVGEERERIVIGLCYIGGDNSEKEFLAWAKQVNPPRVMKRLRAELKQSLRDADRLE